MPISFHIEGADLLTRKLNALPARVEAKVVRGSVVEGARVIRDQARENAPMWHGEVSQGAPPAGTLKKSIIIKYIPEQSRAGRYVYYVGVRHGKKYSKMGKKGINRDAFYWYFVEFGHYTRPTGGAFKSAERKARTGRFGSVGEVAAFEQSRGVHFIPPQSFMRRAFASKHDEASRKILAVMWEGVRREAIAA